MAWLENKKSEILQEIYEIANEKIGKLSALWFEMLERKRCEAHLEKIANHAATFFNDIIDETEERRQCFIDSIAERKQEAADLGRLLKVEFDLSPTENLPLHTALMQMENDLHDLRKKLKDRKDEIISLLLEQETLCEELSEIPRELLDDPLPTEFELQDFRGHLNILIQEKNRRIELVENLRNEIQGYLRDLEINPNLSEDFHILNDSRPLTESSIDRLQKVRDDCRQQALEIRDSIETMRSKVERLWSYLNMSPSIRKKFSKYVDYTQTTYDRYREELERCEVHKRQNIKKFVDAIRVDIENWWDKTMKSDTERARFPYFTNECYTEDLLTLHEMELDNLKQFYATNEKIFDLIEQRKVLWDRMIALEAKASEPGRYNNRGGQLLKEERERKTIATKLPKIEAELTALVKEYEETNKIKFLVFGEDVLESMAHDWEVKKAEKEKLMSARKNATVATTPLLKASVFRTPLTARNQSTVKKTMSTVNLSVQPSTIKRKRLQDGSNENLLPNAKRNLMTDFKSPRHGVIALSASKMSARKPRVIASTIVRRKSGRMSGNNKPRSANRGIRKIPIIKVSREDTQTTDTTSYDAFENHIEKDPSCRSSISAICLFRRQTRLHTRKANFTASHRAFASPIHSPAPSSSRKLTTKDLPILI